MPFCLLWSRCGKGKLEDGDGINLNDIEKVLPTWQVGPQPALCLGTLACPLLQPVVYCVGNRSRCVAWGLTFDQVSHGQCLWQPLGDT